MAKGQENIDKTIDICREIIAALSGMPSVELPNIKDSTEQIRLIIEGLREISGKFFLKSNPSIPPTAACLRRAEELMSALSAPEEGNDHAVFLNALEGFKKAFESLDKKASMRSTVIT
jgi:hypothetical protein